MALLAPCVLPPPTPPPLPGINLSMSAGRLDCIFLRRQSAWPFSLQRLAETRICLLRIASSPHRDAAMPRALFELLDHIRGRRSNHLWTKFGRHNRGRSKLSSRESQPSHGPLDLLILSARSYTRIISNAEPRLLCTIVFFAITVAAFAVSVAARGIFHRISGATLGASRFRIGVRLGR